MKIFGIWNNVYERIDTFFEKEKDARKFVKYMHKEYNIPKEEMPIHKINIFKNFKEFKKRLRRR